MPQERGAHDAFAQNAARIVFAEFELVAHNGHFGREIFRGDKGVHHAIGIEIQRPPEVRVGGGHGLEIVGAIKRSGAIGLRAAFGQFSWSVFVHRRAFEQQMFRQVRHSGLTVPFVPRPDEVGDVDGDRRL